MKRAVLLFSFFVIALVMSAPAARAQGNASRGPDPTAVRDPEMEKDSLHNLEVARMYFKQKKAYLAALNRCREIIDVNPAFSRMDEALYIAGASSLRLVGGKGKQKLPADMSPDQLRDLARDYLSQVYYNFPDSAFRKEAEKELQTLGGPIRKSETQTSSN